MGTINDVLRTEAEATEAAELSSDQATPLPEGTTVTRGNLIREPRTCRCAFARTSSTGSPRTPMLEARRSRPSCACSYCRRSHPSMT